MVPGAVDACARSRALCLELLAKAVDDPTDVVPGAASAVVLTRRQANRLTKINFDD
jgi:hypothetical protein